MLTPTSAHRTSPHPPRDGAKPTAPADLTTCLERDCTLPNAPAPAPVPAPNSSTAVTADKTKWSAGAMLTPTSAQRTSPHPPRGGAKPTLPADLTNCLERDCTLPNAPAPAPKSLPPSPPPSAMRGGRDADTDLTA